jgi:hypothetical protein
MTRQHNQQHHCPNCKTWSTHETLFGRWIRNNPELDSGKGFSVVDCDYWIHRFKTFENREFQCIMLVEVKTCGADLSMAQRDTLLMVNQIMRNRRQTPTKEKRYEAGDSILRVRSAMMSRDVNAKVFGVHKLRFSGLGPDDSDWISWDDKMIDEPTLSQILRFDLDPDTLNPIDLRSHHRKEQHLELLEINQLERHQ